MFFGEVSFSSPKAMSREEIHDSFVKRFSVPPQKPMRSVTADDLRKVEEKLKITFPAAYVAFLTRHGPIFTPGVLDLVTGGESEEAPEGASFDVQEFLDPDEIIKTHQLYTSGGMDDWLIPIASDCMGNIFGFKCVEYKNRPDDSPIFLFDHDFCEIDEEADSFDAWLMSFLKLGADQK